MTNWLADPVACAVRMKTKAGTTEGSGCNILMGRNEVLSRSTRCVVNQGSDGSVTWSWGHLWARRKGVAITLGVEEGTAITFAGTEHGNVAADLLRAAYANSGLSNCGGQTMLEVFWDELMVVYERLMTGTDAEDERDPGRAEGIAYCIAMACNPYLPDVDAVRAQAAERWEAMEAARPASPPSRAESARAARRRLRAGR